MSNTDLARELITQKGYTKQQANKVLRDIEDVIIECVTTDQTVTWKGFTRFYLKKYNENLDRFGSVHYLIGVRHLSRVGTIVKQMTQYLLTQKEIDHNVKIRGMEKQVCVSRRGKKIERIDQQDQEDQEGQ